MWGSGQFPIPMRTKLESPEYLTSQTLRLPLKEEFSISVETDDIIDFSSFKKGIEILKKYKVQI